MIKYISLFTCIGLFFFNLVGCIEPADTEVARNAKPHSTMLPLGIVTDSLDAMFLTTIGSYTDRGPNSMVSSVSHLLAGLTLNGSSVTNKFQVWSTPLDGARQIWNIPADIPNSIPAICDTVSIIDTVHITSPAMLDTVTFPFTLQWSSTSRADSTNGVVISIFPAGVDTNTMCNKGYMVRDIDDGSFTLSSPLFPQIAANHWYTIKLTRFVRNVKGAGSFKALFMSEAESTVHFYVN